VTADKLARLNVTLELTGEIIASLLFSLTTTVGKEDMRSVMKCISIIVQAEVTMPFIMWTSPEKVRGWWIATAYDAWFDLHLNAIFIVAIENLHGLKGLRNGSSPADKDTVDVKSKDKGVGHGLGNSRG
jgi:hypothetical protein